MLLTGDPESGIIDRVRTIVTDGFTANLLRQRSLWFEIFLIAFFHLMPVLARTGTIK